MIPLFFYSVALSIGFFDTIAGSFFVNAVPTCTKSNDCVKANTYTYALKYDDSVCICVCYPGWTGDKCQTPSPITKVNVTERGYVSEYWNVCKYATNYEIALSTCRGFGNGWDIASPSNKDAFVAIAKDYITCVWLGGTTPDLDNWYWNSGRLKGKQFFQNSTKKVYNNFYVEWVPGSPDNDCYLPLTENTVCFSLKGLDDMARYLIDPGHNKPLLGPDCIACERSPCNKLLDCGNTPGFDDPTGYYPDCKCTCKLNWHGDKCDVLTCLLNDCVAKNTYKFAPSSDGNGCMCVCLPGWKGDKCQTPADIPIVAITNRNYSSEYWSTCGYVKYYEYGVQTCKGFGDGWDIAAPTTKEAYDALASVQKFNFGVWVGGRTNDLDNWFYISGRLRGMQFFQNSTKKVFHNFYVPWAPSQPNKEDKGPQNSLCFGTKGLENVRDKLSIPLLGPDCFGCERSPCNISIDCDPNGAIKVTGYYPNCVCENRFCMISKDCNAYATKNVSGIYPNCTCNCSSGYKGKRCQIALTKSTSLPTIPFVTDPFLNPNGSNFLFDDNKRVSSNKIYFIFALCMIVLICLIILIVFFAVTCYKRQKAKKILNNENKSSCYHYKPRFEITEDDESNISSASLPSKCLISVENEKNPFINILQGSFPSIRSNSYNHISPMKSPTSPVVDRKWNVDAFFHDLIFNDFIDNNNEPLTSKQTNVTDVVLVQKNNL